MPRTHGYAPRGARCPGRHDWHASGRGKPPWALGALLAGALLTVGLTEANIDADLFNAWLEHQLIPRLPEAAVVILDNATFHTRGDTRKMIEDAGHTLQYLPSYSPDLNRIEPKWAQAKAIRRKTGCSPDELFSDMLRNQI